MGAHLPRASEPAGLVDRRSESKRRDRADARHTHQATADFLLADNFEDLLGPPGEFAQHRGKDCKQGLNERQHDGIGSGQLPNAIGEGCSSRLTELDTGFAQDRPYNVLDRPHLVEDRSAHNQKRAP